MVEKGDRAPDFTVPIARGAAYNDVEEFTLSENLGAGPVVLAFFPAAFTSGCTEELYRFATRSGRSTRSTRRSTESAPTSRSPRTRSSNGRG